MKMNASPAGVDYENERTPAGVPDNPHPPTTCWLEGEIVSVYTPLALLTVAIPWNPGNV